MSQGANAAALGGFIAAAGTRALPEEISNAAKLGKDGGVSLPMPRVVSRAR